MLAASVLAGCSATGGDLLTSVEPSDGLAARSMAAETAPPDAELPDTVAFTPASFAGRTPDGRGTAPFAETAFAATAGLVRPVAPRSAELDALIARYAAHYDVPVELVRRVVKRESTFDPGARNGPYWGLMQIRHDTARGMGYAGPAHGLLDAETNLRYAVKYLRGAYLTADGNQDLAVRYYSRGYYYDAKRKGLLEETGLGKDRKRRRG